MKRSKSTLTIVYKSSQGPTALDEEIEEIVGEERSSSGFDFFERERDMEWRLESSRANKAKELVHSFLASNSDCISFRIEVEAK
jgi:hypothetical protein